MSSSPAPYFAMPQPPARPGQRPDFGYVGPLEAGALHRPAPSVGFRETVPLTEGLIRVLDDSHRAVGDWDPHVPEEVLVTALGHMVLTRVFDERMFRVQRQGRISSVYRAPVVLNMVNNQWAISTFQGVAGGSRQTFAARGPGYGIAGLRVDGNDFLAVYAATSWAAERARSAREPTVIELVTYRAAGHSTSDDPACYRAADEAVAWPLGDPIERLEQHLILRGVWSPGQHEQLLAQCESSVGECWNEARQYGTLTDGPRADPRTIFDDVLKDVSPELRRQRDQLIEELERLP